MSLLTVTVLLAADAAGTSAPTQPPDLAALLAKAKRVRELDLEA